MVEVQKMVERSIFEVIRKRLVELGWLPDIENPRYNPNTKQGQQNWDNDLAQIKRTKGFAVEVFGASSSQAKGLKKVPRIAINPRRVLIGDVGISFGTLTVDDPLNVGSFVKIKPPHETSDIQFDVHIVTDTAEQHRLLHYIWFSSVGQRGYIPSIFNPEESFFIQQITYYDIPDTVEGIDENVYSYEAKDLMIFEGKVIENISPIKEIEVRTYKGDGAIFDLGDLIHLNIHGDI